MASGWKFQLPMRLPTSNKKTGRSLSLTRLTKKINDGEGWAVAGHQQTGGRTAWFVLPSLLVDSDDAQIRVQLKYKSKFAKHQFRRVRLSLTDEAPSVPEEQKTHSRPAA